METTARRYQWALVVVGIVALIAGFVGAQFVSAFTGPNNPGGTGSGAIGVNSANNLSVGTTTPDANAKFLIAASSTGSSSHALKIVQPSGNTIFLVRNDGNIGVGTSSPNTAALNVQGNIYATGSYIGAFSGSVSANNVTAGVFNNGTVASYSFPGSLGVSTSTTTSLPQALSVYGNGYISGTLGVGTTASGPKIAISNSTGIQLSANSWADFAGSASGYGLFGGNMYMDSSPNAFKYSNTHASIGAMGFAVNYPAWNKASVITSNTTASTAGNSFTPTVIMTFDRAGNVGIATSTPSYKLEVIGTGRFSGDVTLGDSSGTDLTVGGGTGKINAGTVDPIYIIGGIRYATYLPSMTGVKEETTGILPLRCEKTSGSKCSLYRGVIDFSQAPKGSDLWLFAKASDIGRNFGEMTVLLTPSFAGKVWYEKSGGLVTVWAAAETAGASLEVSYRLTSPRFDSAKWSNLSDDQTAGGFVLED